MKNIILFAILFVIIGCGVNSLEEQPYKIYEVTLPNYDKEIVKAKHCTANYKSKIATNTPVYRIWCTNDYTQSAVYNGIGISIKIIESEFE